MPKDTFTAKELHQRMLARIAKHTPGPWTNDGARDDHGGWRVGSETNVTAWAYGEANARLIAAAPELLEAASEALEWLKDGTPDEAISEPEACIRRLLTRAIRRARGEE